MPLISDYASISQAIADFTHRSDLYSPAAGTNITDYFLQAAQEMINKDIFDKNAGNGIQLMEAFYSQTITNGVTTIPTGYLAPKYFKITDNAGLVSTLELKDPQWIYDRYPDRSGSGLPAYIARDLQVSGSVFTYGPSPDSAYAVSGTFYQAAALLNSTNTTNWMVTSAPNTFFAAAMVRAMLYSKDTEGLEIWKAEYEEQIQKLIDLDKGERWGSATLQVELA